MSGGVLSGAAGLSVAGSGTFGLTATGGTLSLEESTLSNNGMSGISLSGSAIASLTSVVLDSNADYGLICDGGSSTPSSSTVTLDPCGLVVSDNVLGPFELSNGCEVDWACTAN